MKIYKVGLIGYGFIGKVHAYSHLNIPLFYDQREFRTEITHVCTAHAETAEKAKFQTGAKHAVTDYREITENPEIDIVDICTPNSLHAEAVLSAIAHGKHIYCDKPLTSNLSDALKIRDALHGYKGISQMTLQNRFFPSTLRAKQLIDEGRIGDILEFRGSFLHSGSSDPNAPLKWKLQAGTIEDLGSHILDMVQYLTGDFSELCAATHIAFPERPSFGDPSKKLPVPAEDSMFTILRLANGAAGTVTASKIATGREDEFSFEIYGTKGALRIEPMNFNKLYFYDMTAPAQPQGGLRGWTAIDCGQRYDAPAGFPTPKAIIGWLRGHVHCMYTFLNSVHTGKAAGPTLEDGVKLQELLEKVKESAATRQWIKL